MYQNGSWEKYWPNNIVSLVPQLDSTGIGSNGHLISYKLYIASGRYTYNSYAWTLVGDDSVHGFQRTIPDIDHVASGSYVGYVFNKLYYVDNIYVHAYPNNNDTAFPFVIQTSIDGTSFTTIYSGGGNVQITIPVKTKLKGFRFYWTGNETPGYSLAQTEYLYRMYVYGY